MKPVNRFGAAGNGSVLNAGADPNVLDGLLSAPRHNELAPGSEFM